jgi:RND superfamily putative drug exporter
MASQAFGAVVTAPLDVVTTFPSKVSPTSPALQRVRDDLLRTDNVLYVAPAIFSTSGQHVLYKVIPTTAPDSQATKDLMHDLRTTFATKLGSKGIQVGVGGLQAIQLDLGSAVYRALPITILAVIGGSFILLMLQFRSIVMALKAGIMNLLSISAAFGVVVAIFQWGWGSHLIGVDHAGPIQNFLPLLLFPAVFGLSMDYEVFLLSRITDEWEKTHDSTAAVTEGLATTGRVVTSGAAIMFALFAAMALSHNRTVEMFGVGLAVAVLVDATLIRSLLLPAAMQLLGRYNWWMPAWLERRLPTMIRHA